VLQALLHQVLAVLLATHHVRLVQVLQPMSVLRVDYDYY
jgi:hypothetical protein